LLIKDVTKDYGDRVEYRDENYGASKFADRFGVQRYPAVFVDDALIARPDDFGFYGKDHDEADKGKYTPWQDTENHKRFQKDLARMIELRLRGHEIESLQLRSSSDDVIKQLPDFEMVTLDGTRILSEHFSGQITLVEFWAPWCPPCQRTLKWLTDVKNQYGSQVNVLAVSVESKEAEVRKMAQALQLPFDVVFGSEEQVAPFGDLFAVPTMYLFNRDGNLASIFYGAPPDLHEKADRLITELMR
jgi:thiol-disulfide isomerase/thioredoxin